MTPRCFVCDRVMRHVCGTFAWMCYRCDVMEEHEEYRPRVRTVKEASSEAFGTTVYIDHSKESIPSPGLFPLVSSPAIRLPTKILPDV